MTAAQQVSLLIPFSYLLGSVPFGLIVGRSKGVDPRLAGSGNIGATNVGRLLGGKFFAAVFLLDMLKGLLPTLIAALLLRGHAPGRGVYVLWLLVGFAAILGHVCSVFLKFHGGKGVATSTGVILGLFPYYTIPGLAGALVGAAAFKLTRYVSLASILGAATFPLAYLTIGLALGWPVFGEQSPLLLFAFLLAALITLRHRSNIARLRAGTEHRFEKKPAAPPAPLPRA